MRISAPQKRFLRIGVLLVIAVASYWVCSSRAETAPRHIEQNSVKPPMYVLQVGIGKYVNAPVWAELRGAVTDVVEMRKVLEGERYGIPPANIVTLTDAQGTKAKIFEQFQTHLIGNARKYFETVKDPKKGAVILFQFSGHGSQVPDVDGDERDDGKDETFVTHDSQDVQGKNFDITDDEIYALTSDLRSYTDNIVYVFDSCHSGSGTRDAEDVRRLPARKTIPEPVAGVGTTTRSGSAKETDGISGVLPPGDEYIVITAARANELASQKNCFEECGETKRPIVYGNLTFYLIDELKNARSDTSYRELMENVTRRVVSEKPTQTPQLEGDKSRFVFGALGRTEDRFIRISGGETKAANGTRSVKIDAGAIQGVTPGTIVSFYDKTVTRFDGVDKIASGTVTAVTPLESTVTLLSPQREVSVNDKSIIVAPDLGSLRLKVDLDADTAKFNAIEKRIVSDVTSFFTRSTHDSVDRGVDLVDAAARGQKRWDVVLLKDKFASVSEKFGSGFLSCENASQTATSPDADVLYFAGRDYVPTFQFCLEARFANADAERKAVARLQDAIVHHAAHKTVNAIGNRRSRLNGKIVVKPIRLPGGYGCTNGTFISRKETAITDPGTGMYPFARLEAFWLEVVNNSPQDLYVVLLDSAPDGSVEILTPRADRDYEQNGVVVKKNGGTRILPGDDCRLKADGDFEDVGAIRASRFSGIERFKLIVSTAPLKRDQFLYLEIAALNSRDSKGLLAGLPDWTTVETIFQINDTGK